MRALLVGEWREAEQPAQRLGYLAGGALIVAGVVHLAAWLAVGGTWQGPVSFRKPTNFGLSFGPTTITLIWATGCCGRAAAPGGRCWPPRSIPARNRRAVPPRLTGTDRPGRGRCDTSSDASHPASGGAAGPGRRARPSQSAFCRASAALAPRPAGLVGRDPAVACEGVF